MPKVTRLPRETGFLFGCGGHVILHLGEALAHVLSR